MFSMVDWLHKIYGEKCIHSIKIASSYIIKTVMRFHSYPILKVDLHCRLHPLVEFYIQINVSLTTHLNVQTDRHMCLCVALGAVLRQQPQQQLEWPGLLPHIALSQVGAVRTEYRLQGLHLVLLRLFQALVVILNSHFIVIKSYPEKDLANKQV